MIKIIKKAPAPATLGKGVGVEESKRTWSQITSTFAEMEDFAAVKSGGLTHGYLSATVEPPNLARRNKRLSCLPRTGKSLVAYSAHHAVGVSIGRFVHIGRVTRLGFREGPAASLRPGSVLPCLFSFKTPKFSEVHHV